jgi:RNA polymerase sigma-70 factor, ECF subfamily
VSEIASRKHVHEEVSQTVSQELQLQQRIREGDNGAFAELYAMHKQKVYSYCSIFLGHRGGVEDVFQDVFIGMLEKLRGGQEIECIGAYLMRSSRNRCLNILRDVKYTRDLTKVEESLTDPDADIDERKFHLRGAVQELADEQRELVILHDYHGYTYDEIAELMELPVTTIRKRLFRARKNLRRMLNPGNR